MSAASPPVPGMPPVAAAAVAVSAALAAVLLAATVLGPYGWFIDELYYLACARRLAWGYVDHPPLSMAVLAAVRGLFGDAMWAVRLPAALAAAAAAFCASLVARRLGGGAFAQALAALCVACAPLALVMGSFFSMNAFELVFWPAAALLLLGLEQGEDARRWLAFGLLMGLALLNKHTSVLFLGAIGASLLLVPARVHLRTPWPWLAVVVAALVLAPNLAWQQAHGWPSLEFYANAQAHKNIATPPFKVLADQILFAGPGAAPVWMAGLWFLLRRGPSHARQLGYAFVLLLGTMLVSGSSRPDRIGAFYPILFGAGAAAIASWTSRGRARGWRAAAVVAVLASGAFVAPLTLPLLPPPQVAAYAQATGVLPRIERGKTSPIPQWLADRTGWPEFVDDVEAVVATLSPEERARTIVYGPSYGQAGALELFGRARGLPPVISNHNTYHLWSAGRTDADVLVAAGARERELRQLYRDVTTARVHRCTYCMSWRDQMPIFVARGPRVPLSTVWPALRKFE